MEPSENIDKLIADHPDWRGELLSKVRRLILDVDPGITEEWKYMGSPVWELDGMLCFGDIYKSKVKIGFLYGASLDDPENLFNGELGGKQRRSVEFAEGDEVKEEPLKNLIRAAIEFNRAKKKK